LKRQGEEGLNLPTPPLKKLREGKEMVKKVNESVKEALAVTRFVMKDEDFEKGDLKKKVIKMYTVSNTRRYGLYTYREAVRLAELEDGKKLILYIDSYYYSHDLNDEEKKKEIESNKFKTKRWQKLKRMGVGRRLKEIVDLEEIKTDKV
jgi:hypothetical protein